MSKSIHEYVLENNILDWPAMSMSLGLLCNSHNITHSDNYVYDPQTWDHHYPNIVSRIFWYSQTSSVTGCTIKTDVGYTTIYVAGYGWSI